jgi:hypothetical protein
MSVGLERGMLAGGLLLALAGVAGVWGAVRVPLSSSLEPMERRPVTAPTPTNSTAHPPANDIAARDLFRPDRLPAPVPFDPLAPGGGAAPVPAPPPRPTLVLVGLVLGSPRAALIRGLDGTPEARLLAEGEEWAGLRVLRVLPDAVVLKSGRDTVRLAWPEEGR